MGRPKVKIIDDSAPEGEIKDQKSKIKKTSQIERARVESAEAISAVEHTSNDNDLSTELGTKQTHSEPTGGRAVLRDSTERASQKPGKAKPRSKKYQAVSQDLDRAKRYPVTEAVDLVKKLSYTKFNATLEAHLNTAQTGIRGLVSLPFASGKKLRILAFGKEAENSGADLVGSDQAIEEINKGKINFDLVVTTPEWMPKLAKVARILGPRGLMPNPKNSTITEDLKKAVSGFQAGKTEYKTEAKAAVIHLAIGKIDQPNEQLIANIKTLLQTVGKTRVKKISLSPTMGPSVKLDLSSL